MFCLIDPIRLHSGTSTEFKGSLTLPYCCEKWKVNETLGVVLIKLCWRWRWWRGGHTKGDLGDREYPPRFWKIPYFIQKLYCHTIVSVMHIRLDYILSPLLSDFLIIIYCRT